MKRITNISNIKVFAADGTELGKVVQAQAVIKRNVPGSIPWLVTVKNPQTVK